MTTHSIEVSSEMVDVGVRVLRESGFLWGESLADPLLVREMLEKVLACPSARIADSQAHAISHWTMIQTLLIEPEAEQILRDVFGESLSRSSYESNPL